MKAKAFCSLANTQNYSLRLVLADLLVIVAKIISGWQCYFSLKKKVFYC